VLKQTYERSQKELRKTLSDLLIYGTCFYKDGTKVSLYYE